MIEGKNTVQKSNRFKIPHSVTLQEFSISQIDYCWLGETTKKKLEILKPSKNIPKLGANVVSTKDSEQIHCRMHTNVREVAFKFLRNAKTQKMNAPMQML